MHKKFLDSCVARLALVAILVPIAVMEAGCMGVGAPIGQHPYSLKVQIETARPLMQTVEVNYLLYLPDTYGKDSEQKWPVILFLHGSGARGNDLEVVRH